ncbi:mediator of RNA polymerase II transcription subunit 29 isoform X1 [Hydra vulgaris]|uniref:mediator of RNA polymerase II transcription subunit 29 isoform X1 n=1 Tax=Hydra vulgaris TaxID=6087 RepID=UPI0002B443F4|nr:mediator of RNA polymerase II transcription subunit 29 isoform X2 [Hydra vulgaris]
MASSTSSQVHPAPLAPSSQACQQTLTDTDPLVKYQGLLPLLRESVMNLIRHTVYVLQNTAIGQCRQTDVQMLNKCMEDFYNISDQVHQWLVLADSTVIQYQTGTRFSPDVFPLFNTDRQQPQQAVSSQNGVLFYSQYLANAKKQVVATDQLRNMLSEFADSLV